ncbi:HAD-IA family hydrolase [Dactylosporangium sp. NPDC049140]|uniref:HAD-IA family hydrolase n=1 Tax=Dactylosporangium sp. NPDC049140 TaxID=3155647 RepID=UPI0033FB5DAC
MSGKPVTAVVFDLDGVLIDSIELMRAAFQSAYAEVVGDGPAPFEEYLKQLGRHMPDILAIMALPARMYPAFVRHSNALVHLTPAAPGAHRLLDELADAGLALAVATGKSRERAEQVLAVVGLRDRLDAVCGSDEVPAGKPAPDIVELALHRLGAAPAEAIMVGDSPLDLRSGRAAGTRTAAALWGQGSAEELLACEPDLAAASCDDLLARLSALIGVRR